MEPISSQSPKSIKNVASRNRKRVYVANGITNRLASVVGTFTKSDMAVLVKDLHLSTSAINAYLTLLCSPEWNRILLVDRRLVEGSVQPQNEYMLRDKPDWVQ
jgi:hypothetical protein